MPPVIIRSLSALILAPLVLGIVYLGGIWFQGLVVLGIVLALHEWLRLCKTGRESGAVGQGERMLWFALGSLYILAACGALVLIRGDGVGNDDGDVGRNVVFFLLGTVWLADTGAYFFGCLIGGPKLAPRISPKKTWAGFIGALIAAAGTGCLYFQLFPEITILELALTGGLIGFVSQVGDLVESVAKRRFDVKDSGSIIPGHGGILDRIDGLMAASLFVLLIGLSLLGGNTPWS